jgi:hypothetical protein
MELLPKNKILIVGFVMIVAGTALAATALRTLVPIGTVVMVLGFGLVSWPLYLRWQNGRGPELEPVAPDTPVIPEKWEAGAMLVTGGGNIGENFLWKEQTAVVENREGLSEKKTFVWPDFKDNHIEGALYSAITGFCLYPVKGDAQLRRVISQGKIGLHNPTNVERGGEVYLLPHLAGHGNFDETKRVMADRRDEIQEKFAILQDMLGERGSSQFAAALYIVADGFTSVSYFAGIDPAGIITLAQGAYQHHIVFYVEGGKLGARYRPAVFAALREETDRICGRISPIRLPIIVADNRNKGETRIHHQRLILMLAGAYSSDTPERSDPSRLVRDLKQEENGGSGDASPEPAQDSRRANVFAPFVPQWKHRSIIQAGAGATEGWVRELLKLDPSVWPCLWSRFDPRVPLVDREGLIILMVGNEQRCLAIDDAFSKALTDTGISAHPIIASVPAAQGVWLAALVPLTQAEMEGSLAAPVFQPLCIPSPKRLQV